MKAIIVLFALLMLASQVSGQSEVTWNWIGLEEVKVSDYGPTVLADRQLGLKIQLSPSMVPPEELVLVTDARNTNPEAITRFLDGTTKIFSSEQFVSGTLRLVNSRENPVISLTFYVTTMRLEGEEKQRVIFLRLLGGYESKLMLDIPIIVSSKEGASIDQLRMENKALMVAVATLAVMQIASLIAIWRYKNPKRGFGLRKSAFSTGWRGSKRARWF